MTPLSVTCPFEVIGWDQTPYDEPRRGPQLARATVRKRFQGALAGESTAELLLCQTDPTDLTAGAGYVASERFEGTLGARAGSFVLQHGGLSGGGAEQRTFGHVVPGSGTRDLAGLAGRVTIAVDAAGSHQVTLDYTLD